MLHKDILQTPKEVVRLVNNYEPYIYRVQLSDGSFTNWVKPKHSFVEIENNQWTAGNKIFSFENTKGIHFRIHTTKGKQEFLFQSKK